MTDAIVQCHLKWQMCTSKLFVVSEPEHPKRVENLSPNAARLLLASANRELRISEERLEVVCFVFLFHWYITAQLIKESCRGTFRQYGDTIKASICGPWVWNWGWWNVNVECPVTQNVLSCSRRAEAWPSSWGRGRRRRGSSGPATPSTMNILEGGPQSVSQTVFFSSNWNAIK